MFFINIGNVHLKKENYDKAIENFLKGFEVMKHTLEKDHSQDQDLVCFNSLGSVYLYIGKYEEAL